MYVYSNDFKNAIYADERKFKITMNVTLADSTNLTITEKNIWSQTMSVESATSASGSFSVGALVASKLTFALNNLYDDFSTYDFIDAKIVLSVGAQLPDGTVEMVRYGYYTITEASVSQNSISIVALDNLSKLSHTYGGEFTFPIDLKTLVMKSCEACSVVLDTGSLPAFMKEYSVGEFEAKGTTYAGLVSYAAQIAGCFVKADHEGHLCFDWYPMQLVSEKADGGTFAYDGKTEEGTPEAVLDGGTFKFNDGDSYDGGSFRDLMGYHSINSTTSANIATDNVVITGVRVTDSPVDSEVDSQTVLVGVEGYVLDVSGNPLIQSGQAADVANNIFSTIGGLAFRPLTCSILPDPSIEAGDVGYVADKANYYLCFFSSVKFCPDAECTVTCDAQSKNRQNASLQNALSEVLQKSKQWIAYEKTSRELALEDLTTLMSNALGFFSSEVVQPDGSTIKYLHNKPVLSQSDIQWKITVDGVGVSTDYGAHWNFGVTKDGNMVANTLSAVGVNADWINAGTITGRTIRGGEVIGTQINNGNGTFSVNSDGTVIAKNIDIQGGSINIETNSGNSDIIRLKYSTYEIELWTNRILVKDSYTGSQGELTPTGVYLDFSDGSQSWISQSGIVENGTSLSGKYAFKNTETVANDAKTAANEAKTAANTASSTASSAYSVASSKADKNHTHRPADLYFSAGHYRNQSVYAAIDDLHSRVKALEK